MHALCDPSPQYYRRVLQRLHEPPRQYAIAARFNQGDNPTDSSGLAHSRFSVSRSPKCLRHYVPNNRRAENEVGTQFLFISITVGHARRANTCLSPEESS